MLLAAYAIITLLYWVFLTPWLIINGRKIQRIATVESTEMVPAVSVVIIIAVRNEEYALREALTSVCNLAYSNYTVLVINDRSTDNSQQILSEMAAQYSRLSFINIDTLPAGWLGKNHALYRGSTFSHEEYLLFTDADVLYDKNVLNKAMNFCRQHNLDHLTILPDIISPSAWLKSIVTTFVLMLTALQRPWAAKIKTSKTSMGVGAFNLVRRQAYMRAGTHKAIAMRPDDDLKLAKYIKKAGGAADVLYGQQELRVEWYASVREFINGLMKNTFSGFDYNIFKALGGAFGILLFFTLPLPALLIFGNYPERIIAILIFILQLLLYRHMPGAGDNWRYAFMTIYASIIIAYVIIRAAISTLYQGGIYWRGTFYSLSELRKNK